MAGLAFFAVAAGMHVLKFVAGDACAGQIFVAFAYVAGGACDLCMWSRQGKARLSVIEVFLLFPGLFVVA